MNILFLTMYNFRTFSDRGIYEDLMREFVRQKHHVFVVAPTEKRNHEITSIAESGEMYRLLRVRTGNLQKTNLLEKGIATLQVSSQFKRAIKRFFSKQKFDLILYSTPPITLAGVVEYIKKRDNAKTFLLLKDIFPQNAVDIDILSKTGWRGVLYRYFRKKERKLYDMSDYIGCMSDANKSYILDNNPKIHADKVKIIPNSIEPQNISLTDDERVIMRNKYEIPQDKIVLAYGGNFGKPQGVSFIIECLKSQKDNENIYFLLAGDGIEFERLQTYIKTEKPRNVKLLKRLPREDFDHLLAACDIGMIFLDYRFTIPNYPSRLLSYMQSGLPVLACTDPNTDVGKDIVDGGFGWWCKSDNVNAFIECIKNITTSDLTEKGHAARLYLQEHFTVERGYGQIINTIGDNE